MAITAWDILTTNWLWLAQAPRDPAIEFDVGDLGDGEVARDGDPLGRGAVEEWDGSRSSALCFVVTEDI